MTLKFYISVVKGWKLEVREFWGLSPTFVEATYSEKTGMGAFLSSPILRIQVQLTGHQKVFSDTKARILMAYFDGGSLWNLLTELDVCQDLK